MGNWEDWSRAIVEQVFASRFLEPRNNFTAKHPSLPGMRRFFAGQEKSGLVLGKSKVFGRATTMNHLEAIWGKGEGICELRMGVGRTFDKRVMFWKKLSALAPKGRHGNSPWLVGWNAGRSAGSVA